MNAKETLKLVFGSVVVYGIMAACAVGAVNGRSFGGGIIRRVSIVWKRTGFHVRRVGIVRDIVIVRRPVRSVVGRIGIVRWRVVGRWRVEPRQRR
jgi:hypothetical protein